MNRFRELLAEEIRETAHRAAAHERAGATDLADWWRQRGRDLCDYLEATSLALSAPSPGQRVIPRPSPALPRTG
jgi:hypothetical protein